MKRHPLVRTLNSRAGSTLKAQPPTLAEQLELLAAGYRYADDPADADVATVLSALARGDREYVAELATKVRTDREAADRKADQEFRDEWLERLAGWKGPNPDRIAREFVEAVVYGHRLERWLKIIDLQADVDGLSEDVSAALRRAFEHPRRTRKNVTEIPGMVRLRAALRALGRLNSKQISDVMSYKDKR